MSRPYDGIINGLEERSGRERRVGGFRECWEQRARRTASNEGRYRIERAGVLNESMVLMTWATSVK
jgi:hypothetical protein